MFSWSQNMSAKEIQSICFILKNIPYFHFNFKRKNGLKNERTRAIYLKEIFRRLLKWVCLIIIPFEWRKQKSDRLDRKLYCHWLWSLLDYLKKILSESECKLCTFVGLSIAGIGLKLCRERTQFWAFLREWKWRRFKLLSPMKIISL